MTTPMKHKATPSLVFLWKAWMRINATAYNCRSEAIYQPWTMHWAKNRHASYLSASKLNTYTFSCLSLVGDEQQLHPPRIEAVFGQLSVGLSKHRTRAPGRRVGQNQHQSASHDWSGAKNSRNEVSEKGNSCTCLHENGKPVEESKCRSDNDIPRNKETRHLGQTT